MAEFCLDCWNKLNKENLTKKDVHLSKEPELCEGCAVWKPVTDDYRNKKASRILPMFFPREWTNRVDLN